MLGKEGDGVVGLRVRELIASFASQQLAPYAHLLQKEWAEFPEQAEEASE